MILADLQQPSSPAEVVSTVDALPHRLVGTRIDDHDPRRVHPLACLPG
ncbi:hypothetical protein ACWKWC_01250 [Geodermatophilus nigrescens]